jgi:hypothetical protein
MNGCHDIFLQIECLLKGIDRAVPFNRYVKCDRRSHYPE